MEKNKARFFFLLVLILAAFLRFAHLRSVPPGLYWDEAINGNNALNALRTGEFKVFYLENNGREGLFVNIQAGFLKLFRVNEPWVLRFPSALFGTLTVAGIYLLARELFSESVGLLSAFLMATSFWHLLFSRIAFRAITAPFFLTWSLALLIVSFRKAEEQRTLSQIFPYTVLAGIIYGLGFHSYISYQITPFLVIPVVLVLWRRSNNTSTQRTRLLITVTTVLLTLVAIGPLAYFAVGHSDVYFRRSGEVSLLHSPTPFRELSHNIFGTAAMFNFRGDRLWRHNYSGRPELFWPVGILLWVGTLGGIAVVAKSSKGHTPAQKRDRFGFSLVLAWLVLAGVPVVFSYGGIPHALRSILMIPPIFILAATGGVRLYGVLVRRLSGPWVPFASALFLCFLALESYHSYFVAWAKRPEVSEAFNADWVDLGRYLNRFPSSTPRWIVLSPVGVFANGLPMHAQPIMFITDTFSPENQDAKKIHYRLGEEGKDLAQGEVLKLVGDDLPAGRPYSPHDRKPDRPSPLQ